MDLHICRINLGATSVSELTGEKTDKCHDHKTSQAHPFIQCDYCFLKTEKNAPMVTILVATDTVYEQMVAIPLEKKGHRDPFCKSQSGRICTNSSDIPQ